MTASAPAPLKKVAFIARVYSHLRAFHMPYMKLLQDQGFEVHAYACPDFARQDLLDLGCKLHDMAFERFPAHPRNAWTLHRLKNDFRKERFLMIHAHTLLGGLLGRVAARLAHVPVVLYTAHGFQFFKGGPLSNWVYYPVERFLARWTDGLITVNREDYQLAAQFGAKGCGVYHVNGMGVNIARFRPGAESKERLRARHGIPSDAQVLLSVGELNRNKNQIQVVRALPALLETYPKLQFLIAGTGGNEARLREQIRELKLEEHVRMLGHRNDIPELLSLADVYLLTSGREGLPFATIEAMAAGLPVIMTKSVGGRCLIEDGVNGFLVEVHDVQAAEAAIRRLLSEPQLAARISEANMHKAEQYALERIMADMERIYSQFLSAKEKQTVD